MKLALIGYGKMGKAIEELASSKGFSIVARLTSETPLSFNAMKGAEVAVEFTHPDVVLKNLHTLATFKIPTIIGTTGWYEQRSEIHALYQASQTPAIYSENFSLGMQVYLKLIEKAAILFQDLSDYDAAINESHHAAKADSPSGTALAMKKNLLRHLKRFETLNISSTRVGHETGEHTLIFDSPFDTLQFMHRAKNRQGIAAGVLMAAARLQTPGLIHFRSLI